ncbi:hypothetical protein [Desulfolucanica intricata]|uniref:hypothetical protein n=1 Tax=Desulfolucanica intricata TaxID=1285191 RepID=UPI000AB2A683|nr:hypothetical protein [Desulfolucanica intricata]
MENVNPYTLFLILILLILSTQPNSSKELEKISQVLSVMQESSSQLKKGMAKIQSILQ